MLSFLKQSFARGRAYLRGELGDKPLIDHEAFEAMMGRSRIPAVLMLVLVWTVSSVLLIMSGLRQYHTQDMVLGQLATRNIIAEVEFKDEAATDKLRRTARERVPAYYRLDEKKTRRILDDVDEFFKRVAQPQEEKSAAKPAVSGDPKISPGLKMALAEAYNPPGRYQEFRRELEMRLNRGINRTGLGSKWRIVGRDDFTPRKTDTVDGVVDALAKQLLPGGFESNQAEFRKVLKGLIGSLGNLEYDAKFTDAERDKAAGAVNEVKVSKGTLLIGKGEKFTEAHRKLIDAERRAIPESTRQVAFRQMAWSFVVLLGGVLFLYMFSSDIRRDNLRITLAGITVAVALAINFISINYLKTNIKLDSLLVIAAVPVAFCSVVLSLVLDLRTAFCCGGVVAVISAMMILPGRSLELALRWTAISSGAALAVHHVGNYRSFFVRTVLAVLALTFVLNVDVVFWGHAKEEFEAVFKQALLAIPGNAVVCAMLSLLMIFVLELFFNLSTDMALMVLSDCNHPLVERLKREAPGTMAHSMAVATLAEDAARAIGANPLRAKAGALFHDVGKLTRSQYFTENNPDSASLHDRLTPQKSARIICDHVTDGVALARQHRLCRFVRSVIATHHGDDLVRFFYNKALDESKRTGVPVSEEPFRYSGTPPKSKEEGIISLADACEAASRSLKNPTPESIAALVGNIIQGRFRDGMLRNSRLTAAELAVLRESFSATLSSMMHGRISYSGGPAAEGEKKC